MQSNSMHSNSMHADSDIVPGVGSDRVVSVGLTRDQMHEVGIMLNEIEAEDEADDDRPCIGFQCRIDKA